VQAVVVNDAAVFAQVAPTAMIFIPCRNGLSHHPDEFAAPEDLERGVKTLALTMARLAGSTADGAEPDRTEL
jgi:acetylornithine deacetylase/succinyl-diaminopimelate desuccinylase-like protein